MAKYGWVIHFSNSSEDIDYTDDMQEPYNSEEEAYEAAQEVKSNISLGANMSHVMNPEEYPETSEDLEEGEIEVYEV